MKQDTCGGDVIISLRLRGLCRATQLYCSAHAAMDRSSVDRRILVRPAREMPAYDDTAVQTDLSGTEASSRRICPAQHYCWSSQALLIRQTNHPVHLRERALCSRTCCGLTSRLRVLRPPTPRWLLNSGLVSSHAPPSKAAYPSCAISFPTSTQRQRGS